MKDKKKIILILACISLVISITLGLTYAYFNYTRTGDSNRLIVGDIYLHLNNGNDSINMTNVFPMTKEEARLRTDNVLEFTISGLNESNKDIWYEIDIKHGDEENGKIRINDSDLVFDLVEIDGNNETYVVDAKSYNDITNKRIWVDTVDASTTTEVTKTYKLRVWVSENVLISDSDPNASYPATGENAFKNHYASVKVGVIGDFNEKELPGALNKIKKNVITPVNAINFANVSSDTNGKGLYILPGTENDTNPIYYYRGDVNNNNVVFGGFCWQIVRTTDTGGVKMIYNGDSVVSESEGETTYNCGNDRPAGHIGGIETTTDLSQSTGYFYADDYEIVSISETTVTYRLKPAANPITQLAVTSSNASTVIPDIAANYPYTCKQTSATGTCTILYKVDSLSSGTMVNVYASTLRDKIGDSVFNYSSYNTSISDIGYMYNTRYAYKIKNATTNESILSSTLLNTTYWYSDTITWGSPIANNYNLDNPYQVSGTSDYPNLVGKYTFRNSMQSYSNTFIYYIAAVNNATMYYIQLTNTGNHTLTDFNYTYTYGDGYTDNHDNTYTITDTNSVTTINRSDWYTSYSNLVNKYVCKNATNNICSELWYVTSTSNTSMTYLKVSNIKFSQGISNYNSTTSTYTLDNDNSVSFWDITNSTNKTSLNNHHYTCWNEEGTCQTLSYIYNLGGTEYYYINLTNGEMIEDALYKMTGNGSNETKQKYSDYVLNQTDSTIKTYIDAWFKTNLTNEEDSNKINYREYLEDTVFCNDRSFKTTEGKASYPTYNQSGWNPNGGDLTKYLRFGTWNRYVNDWYSTTNIPQLTCLNEVAQFTVSSSNGNGALKYPVGLLTGDEIVLAGAPGKSNISNQTYYLYTEYDYWGISPSYFSNTAAGELSVTYTGSLDGRNVNISCGIRPVASLARGTEFEEGGDGTPTNPYVVKYN